MKKIAIALAMSVCIAACAPIKRPSTTEIQFANYGSPIAQADAEHIAKGFINDMLKDPESARWDCDSIYKGWLQDGLVGHGAVHYGYRLDCNVNAKNSFGGYTGKRAYQFIIKNNQLDAVYGEQTTSGGGSYMEKIL
jgi:hypothetical protein